MHRARWMADIAYMDVELTSTPSLFTGVPLDTQLAQFRAAMDATLGQFPNTAGDDLKNLVLIDSTSVYEMQQTWAGMLQHDELECWSSMIGVISGAGPRARN